MKMSNIILVILTELLLSGCGRVRQKSFDTEASVGELDEAGGCISTEGGLGFIDARNMEGDESSVSNVGDAETEEAGESGESDGKTGSTDEPWDALINDMGDVGWKNSGYFLCTDEQVNIESFYVWSDSRGVFVLVSGFGRGDYYRDDNSKCIGAGCYSSTIYFNDGNKWDTFYKDETGILATMQKSLTGFEGGPLITFGTETTSFLQICGLAMIDDDTKNCESQLYSVRDVFVVDENLAYGITGNEIIRYNGSTWGPLPVVASEFGIDSIWANQTHLFILTRNIGEILTLYDGTWQQQDTGTLQSFSAIWGLRKRCLGRNNQRRAVPL